MISRGTPELLEAHGGRYLATTFFLFTGCPPLSNIEFLALPFPRKLFFSPVFFTTCRRPYLRSLCSVRFHRLNSRTSPAADKRKGFTQAPVTQQVAVAQRRCSEMGRIATLVVRV